MPHAQSRTYGLKSLLVVTAFASVLLGWYVDHRNTKHQLSESQRQLSELSKRFEKVDNLVELRLSKLSLIGDRLSKHPEIELLADNIFRPGDAAHNRMIEYYKCPERKDDTVYLLTPCGNSDAEGSFNPDLLERKYDHSLHTHGYWNVGLKGRPYFFSCGNPEKSFANS